MAFEPRTNGQHEDPLSAAALAGDWLLQNGFGVPDDDSSVVTDERATLDVAGILDYEIPEVSTLPFLGRDGMILQGGSNLIYSYPKVGKTELLTAMVKGWVREGQRVLYLTEEAFPNWKKRLGVHGYQPSDKGLRMHYALGYRVDDAIQIVQQETFDILVVDTLRNTVGYLEGKGDEDVARVLHPLLRAAKTTTVCSYHARKMPGDGGRDISGHHSLYGVFDRAMQIVRVDGEDRKRRVTVSGRCLYDGDLTLTYKQESAGVFKVLDGESVQVKAGLVVECEACGIQFEAKNSMAKFCTDVCRKRTSRKVDAR